MAGPSLGWFRPQPGGITYRKLGAVARRVLPPDLRVAVRAFVLLPPRIAWFYIRAHLVARRRRDHFSLFAPMRPEDLSALLSAASGSRFVVELGTGTGWTAAALALADRRRAVLTYDPVPHSTRDWYFGIAGTQARARIRQRWQRAEEGPSDGDPPVDFLFIDIGGHSRADTAAAFLAWRDALAPHAVVAFHDYGSRFPGVPMAIAQLGLEGSVVGESLFVSRPAE